MASDSKYELKGFNKLAGHEMIEPKRDDGIRTTYRHTYLLQAIPTVFDGFFGSTEAFQYTTSEYSKEGTENAVLFM